MAAVCPLRSAANEYPRAPWGARPHDNVGELSVYGSTDRREQPFLHVYAGIATLFPRARRREPDIGLHGDADRYHHGLVQGCGGTNTTGPEHPRSAYKYTSTR